MRSPRQNPRRCAGATRSSHGSGSTAPKPRRRRFADPRIAPYETPDSAVSGFLHRVHYRRNQELLMETPPARTAAFEPDLASARRIIATGLPHGKSWLTQEET